MGNLSVSRMIHHQPLKGPHHMASATIAQLRSADTGDGAAGCASGSHTCSGNCADLPIAPMNRQMQITVTSIQSVPGNVSAPSSAVLANASA